MPCCENVLLEKWMVGKVFIEDVSKLPGWGYTPIVWLGKCAQRKCTWGKCQSRIYPQQHFGERFDGGVVRIPQRHIQNTVKNLQQIFFAKDTILGFSQGPKYTSEYLSGTNSVTHLLFLSANHLINTSGSPGYSNICFTCISLKRLQTPLKKPVKKLSFQISQRLQTLHFPLLLLFDYFKTILQLYTIVAN